MGLGLSNLAYLAFHGPMMGLRAAMGASARPFTNPFERAPLRNDFPEIVTLLTTESDRPRRLWETIQQELGKRGIDPAAPQTIYIAYPHKHPVHRPWHENTAQSLAARFRRSARKLAPHINWVLMDAVYERASLSRGQRTRHQGSVYALSKPQRYGVAPELQIKKAPFLNTSDASANFVVIDDVYEQGTTAANLINFLQANGGYALAAAGEEAFGPRHLKQENIGYWDRGRFIETSVMECLGQAFEGSAQRAGLKLKAAECLDMFEQALKPHGLSIDALTVGECIRLRESVGEHSQNKTGSFMDLIESLNKTKQKKLSRACVTRF